LAVEGQRSGVCIRRLPFLALAVGDKFAHLGGQRSRTWTGRCCVRCSVDVSYQPMTLADLARLVAAEADFDAQWRLVVEFLKEYHQEPAGVRLGLLEDTPGPVGDERWDVLFAGLAEHLAMRDGQAAPGWSATRGLRRFWFPFDTPGARGAAPRRAGHQAAYRGSQPAYRGRGPCTGTGCFPGRGTAVTAEAQVAHSLQRDLPGGPLPRRAVALEDLR
jgi:hypothetical protein